MLVDEFLRIGERGAEALDRLRWEISREPSADKLYSYGELSYVEAKRLDAKGEDEAALDHYAAAVAHAYLYLFDPTLDRFRNPYAVIHRADIHTSIFEAVETSPLIEFFTQLFAAKTRAEWEAFLEPIDLCWGTVRSLKEGFEDKLESNFAKGGPFNP